MVSFTVRMKFAEADKAELEKILRALTVGSRAEAGCVSYIAHFVVDESGPPAAGSGVGGEVTVLIYEQYKDEAAVEAHRKSPHFVQYADGGLYQMMRGRMKEMLVAVE